MSEIINIEDWEVLTPSGWSDFDGIKRTKRDKLLKLVFKSGNHLVCTDNHLVKLGNSLFVDASHLFDGDVLEGGEVVHCIETVDEEQYVYDLIEVKKKHEYYTNTVVSHNCAHIDEKMIKELWLSAAPTLSTGGSAVLISTPNGTENLFYRIWDDSVKGLNEFKRIELPWTVHPERDEEWYKRESADVYSAYGRAGVLQEFHCVFVASGDTFLGEETMQKLELWKCNPASKNPFDKNFWIWKNPEADHRYLLTADVGAGKTDGDFSTICIFDITNKEVVAEYQGKILPQDFALLLIDIGKQYNNAMICFELNSTYGGVVAEILRSKSSEYPYLYYDKMNNDITTKYTPERNELPGWKTAQTNRPEMLAKLDYALSSDQVKVYSERLISELKHFIWKNNKPQAAKGKHDDLVIAYSIGCALLISNVGAEDQEKKPLSKDELKSLYSCIGSSHRVLSTTNGAASIQPTSAKPVVFIGDLYGGALYNPFEKKNEEVQKPKPPPGEFDWLFN